MNKRNVKVSVDPALIANNQYNEASGAQKQMDVGPHLLALNSGGTPTTTPTTATALPSMGKSVAVYNNANAVAAIAFGPTAASLTDVPAPGVIAASGAVGLPIPPNSWAYFSAGQDTFVKSSVGTCFVFLIDDQSSLVRQS